MISALCALLVFRQAGAVLYVAPNGNDQWSGALPAPNAAKTDGPLASFEGARNKVRTLPRTAPISVQFRQGRYEIHRSVQFGAEDSGAPGAPVVYESYPGERAVFSGGRRITGWQKQGDVWSVSLPTVASGAWKFSQLYVEGQRRPRPVLPETGSYEIKRDVDATPENKDKGYDRLAFAGNEINSDWVNQDDVEILSFHQWEMARNLLKSVDSSNKIATFKGHTRGLGKQVAYRVGIHYIIENAKEGFTQPGQWYLDRSAGTLQLRPKAGEDPNSEVVIAPVVAELITVKGPADGGEVHDLTFRNLDLQETGWNLTADVRSPGQGETDLDGTIEVSNASKITVEGCHFARTGAYGVNVKERSHDIVVADNVFSDLGGGGVKVGPFLKNTDPGVRGCDHVTIKGNAVVSLGRLHPSSNGIMLGQVHDALVEHNTIKDGFLGGISVGWTWGYEPAGSHDNVITDNLVSQLGQNLLNDIGGIYNLGPSPRSRIKHNRISSVSVPVYGGWGIYLDEGSSELIVENNLVSDTQHGSLHINFGRDNVIRNNIMSFGSEFQVRLSRKTPDHAADFDHNIVVFDTGKVEERNWLVQGMEAKENLYWGYGTASGEATSYLERARKAGMEAGSVVADPGFTDPDQRDFSLRSTGTVRKIGFEPFDMNFGCKLSLPPTVPNPWPSVK